MEPRARGKLWGRSACTAQPCYLPAVHLSARRLNRATLARQFLLERRPLPVVDAVRRLVALQAQEPASPYLALWNRLEGFVPAELDEALRALAVVKAPLMRITLHAVVAEDRAPFHRAMTPTLRAARLNDRRFRASGLSVADADALVPHVLAFARRPRSRQEIEAALAERLGAAADPGVWWALRTIAPLVHAPAEAPWAFGRSPRYVAAPDVRAGEDPPAPGDPAGADEAVAATAATAATAASAATAATAQLVRRYLAAFGPATRQDFAQFALLRQTEVGPAFESLGGALRTLRGPAGETLYDVPDAPLPDDDAPAPARLLPMWDSVLLAYKDRGRVIPPAYRTHVVRRNGDVLPTVLVDGYVAGVWRPRAGGIEVTAFHALEDDDWDGIEREARELLAFLAGRDDAVYGRFGHWWSRLPGAQVRQVEPNTTSPVSSTIQCTP